MENVSKLFEQVQEYEQASLFDKAQSLREKLLKRIEPAPDKECILLCERLLREKVSIAHLEGANRAESFYLRLHEIVEKRAGSDHLLMGLAKRKLAKVFVVQGRFPEAVSLTEQAWRIFEIHSGVNSDNAIEAIHCLLGWGHYIDSAKAAALEEEIWSKHPLCEHLRGVENHSVSSGIRIVRREVTFRGEVHVNLDAWLDLESIRAKFQLPQCVENLEFDDMKAGSTRGFGCKEHKHSIEGYYERVGKSVVS
jgi:hypothetical protein